MIVLKVSWMLLVSVGAVVLSRVIMGTDGTRGALLGLGIGAVLCLVNWFIMARVRKAEGKSLKLIMAGVIASFSLLIVAVLLVNYWAAPLVKPATLTALVVYLAYRGVDVFELSRPAGIVASHTAFSPLTTADAKGGKEAR